MESQQCQQEARPKASDWESGSRMRALVHMMAIFAGLYICYLLALPFLPAFTWALTMAILFYPAHRRLKRRIRQPGLAALVSVLLAASIVVVPSVFLIERVLLEASRGASLIKQKLESDEWKHALEDNPQLFPFGDLLDDSLEILDLNIPALIGNAVAWLANMSTSLVRISVGRLVILLISFYFLFYFLRDRAAVLRLLCSLSPLSMRDMKRLFVRVADTVHATVYGTLVVASVQGTLGGLMFWWLGLSLPVLWGVIMGLLAIVPVLGTFIIWIPAALFLAIEGRWIDALTLTVWGTVVIAGIDNLIYPILVGNRLKLHTVPAFVSIVGGLILFGASGVILGPLALTITLFLLEVWRERTTSRPIS